MFNVLGNQAFLEWGVTSLAGNACTKAMKSPLIPYRCITGVHGN